MIQSEEQKEKKKEKLKAPQMLAKHQQEHAYMH